MLDYLKKSWKSEELNFSATMAKFDNPGLFIEFLKDLYCYEWVVCPKPPFKNPEMLLEYLGRYTHKI